MAGHKQLGGELEQDDQQCQDQRLLPGKQSRQGPRPGNKYDGGDRQSHERSHDAVDAPPDAAGQVGAGKRNGRGGHGPVRVAAAAEDPHRTGSPDGEHVTGCVHQQLFAAGGLQGGRAPDGAPLPGPMPDPAAETHQDGKGGGPRRNEQCHLQGNHTRYRGAGPQRQDAEERPVWLEAHPVGENRSHAGQNRFDGDEPPGVDVVDGQDHAYRYPAEQDNRGLALVQEAELVRFRAPVHSGQGTEDGVHDEVGPSRGQEQEGRDSNADGHPQGGEVVPVGGFQPVKGAHLVHQKLHAAPPLPVSRIPKRSLWKVSPGPA
jgi:hypothetical protein